MVKQLVTKAELSRMAGVTAAAVTKAIKNGLQDAVEGKRIDANHHAVVEWLESRQVSGATLGIDELYYDAIKACKEKGQFSVAAIRSTFKIGPRRAGKILDTIKAAKMDKPGARLPPKPPPPTPPTLPVIAPGVANTSNTKKQHSLVKLNNEESNVEHVIPENILIFADMTLRELIQRFGTDVAFLDYLKAIKEIENINEKRLKNAATKGQLVNKDLIKTGVIDHVNATHQKLLTDGAKTINKRVRTLTLAGSDEQETELFIIDQISSFIRPMKTKISRALRDV